MTTTIFDTAAHPRILDGTFTAKQQTAPDAIDLTRPVSHGLIDEVPTVFDATDFGAPARHIDKIELTYQPDLDVVHVRAGRSLDVAAMRPKGMSELGWLTRLDEKQAAVKTYFAEQFGADIDVTETWNDAVAWGELEPVADIATPAEVRVLAGRHAGLTKLDANISWRTIEDDLDAYLRVHQVADEDSITDSLTVEEAQVRQQVRAQGPR